MLQRELSLFFTVTIAVFLLAQNIDKQLPGWLWCLLGVGNILLSVVFLKQPESLKDKACGFLLVFLGCWAVNMGVFA